MERGVVMRFAWSSCVGCVVALAEIVVVGCGGTTTAPTTNPKVDVGSGEVKFHSYFNGLQGDEQRRDGTAQFSVVEESGRYTVFGSGTAKFVETVKAKMGRQPCNWRFEANGTASITGALRRDCKLEFQVEIVWGPGHFTSVACGALGSQLVEPSLETETFKIGPLLPVTRQPLAGPMSQSASGEWIGEESYEFPSLSLAPNTGCSVQSGPHPAPPANPSTPSGP
jgi:hypothetical protein